MTNLEIAELLRSVAAAYQLKDEKKNFFKITAYQRAADAVEHATSELKDVWDDGKLEEVPGIGPSIAKHLDELFRKGRSRHFEEIMAGLPASMFDLMKVPGIGAKTAFKLAKELKIKSLDELAKAVKKGKIADIEGFGKQSEEAIGKSIKEVKERTIRILLPYAQKIADEVLDWLKNEKSVTRADALGSLRRKAATVGDVDLAAASENPQKTIDHFTKYPNASRVLEKGTRTAAIIVAGGKQVDLMVESPQSYGALLQHFTGSKHHNIALRELALKKDLSVSDYGIYVKKAGKKVLKKIPTEEEFYRFLGMDFIPPELRENSGEIEQALKHRLPKLVELEDVKGDLQVHSDFDIETSHDIGASSMKDLVKRAEELGYEYLAFTDHNPSRSGHGASETVELIQQRKEAIEQLKYSRVKKVFNSLEIDILPQGELAVPEKALEFLDFALVSIHSAFKLSKSDMTKRVLTALAYPKVKIFAHPTARKLNERESVELNWPEIFDFCVKNNKWVEINADPMRLDLPDTLVREAVKEGVKLTLGTDAHHVAGLDNMRYGVFVARRGWAEAKDIVNTRPLHEFEKMLL